MNKVILMGRLTKNPEIKYAGKDNDMAVARYTLAVNRRYKRDGEQEADFISCVTFGKSAEFVQKYLHKGTRIVIGGRISTGNYKDKDGKTIYTTDVIVEEHEFAQNKDNGAGADLSETQKTDKKQEYQDNTDRIEVERRFSLAKRCFGLGMIRTKLKETQLTSIALSVFVANLFRKMQRILFALLFCLELYPMENGWLTA